MLAPFAARYDSRDRGGHFFGGFVDRFVKAVLVRLRRLGDGRLFAEFFTLELANQLVRDGVRADLVIGNNVLAQVPDLNDFVAGVKQLLQPDGVVTMEFPHLARLVEENQFDTIYHEHFSYFSFSTACRIFAAHGLTVFDVDEVSTDGGSLRIYARAWNRRG